MKKKNPFAGEKGKINSFNLNFLKSGLIKFLIIFLIGLILGAYIGVEYAYPILKKAQVQEKSELTTKHNLCVQEVDCYIQRCPEETVNSCSEL